MNKQEILSKLEKIKSEIFWVMYEEKDLHEIITENLNQCIEHIEVVTWGLEEDE